MNQATAFPDSVGLPGVVSTREDEQQFLLLKSQLHERLIGNLNVTVLRSLDPEQLRNQLRRGAEELCGTHVGLMSQADRERMINDLVHEALGLARSSP